VELSVQYREFQDIHILGYLFDPQHEPLQTRLRAMQHRRLQRGEEILARINHRLLQRGLLPLDPTRVKQRARGALARPHVAQELMAAGYVRSMEEAFREFLIPCDVPKGGLSPAEAFALVAQAGGICSLAHPGVLSPEPRVLEGLISTFKVMGLTGLEVYHHSHDPASLDFFLRCARQYGLVATGGSDYHGRPQGAQLGEMAPGQALPPHLVADLRGAHAARQRESA
jgi:predicted metal-dependent phosphoesterase TrpH